jgi:hypothetical protein
MVLDISPKILYDLGFRTLYLTFHHLISTHFNLRKHVGAENTHNKERS